MGFQKFPLDSEQLELLWAIENTEGLRHLARTLGRDPSVVSKNIKRLAECAPVIKKVGGKWLITPVGRDINQMTSKYLEQLSTLVPTREKFPNAKLTQAFREKRLLLLVVNAQQAFLDPIWGEGSHPEARENIRKMLSVWRKNQAPIIHVRHVSDDAQHPFYLGGRVEIYFRHRTRFRRGDNCKVFG